MLDRNIEIWYMTALFKSVGRKRKYFLAETLYFTYAAINIHSITSSLGHIYFIDQKKKI